jgi:copper chaperone CopZ
MKERYEVKGMTCGGCQRALVGALNRAGIAVTPTEVSVPNGTVDVPHGVNVAELRAAVDAAGFELVGKAPLPVG